jgi:hypothetical protein
MSVVEFFRLFGAAAFLLLFVGGVMLQLTYGFCEDEWGSDG